MTRSNVEVVRELFERFAADGIEAAVELVHPDLVIEVPPDMSAEPDTYHGREGMRRYFAGFEGMLEDVTYEARELIPEGDRVLALARLGGRGVTSGLDVALEVVVLHELKDGLVWRIRPYQDMESARAAGG